jgi:uncharacterized membrane protein YcaP (DUF421 family)
MSWLTGSGSELGIVAAKAALIYLTATLGLRVGERRTLAQWTVIDVAAAVAIGAIIGRTAVASTQSYLVGAVALLTILAAHRLLSVARLHPALGRILDHRVRILLSSGTPDVRQLRLCGLTAGDLHSALRQHNVDDLAAVRYVLYESNGALTIVCQDRQPSAPLLAEAVADASRSRGRRPRTSRPPSPGVHADGSGWGNKESSAPS